MSFEKDLINNAWIDSAVLDGRLPSQVFDQIVELHKNYAKQEVPSAEEIKDVVRQAYCINKHTSNCDNMMLCHDIAKAIYDRLVKENK